MSTILGLHLGHDASVTLLRDGVPLMCMAEERLAREKMYYGFPFRAVDAVLGQYGVSPRDVEVLALDTMELPRILGPDEMQRRFARGGLARDIGSSISKTKHLLNYFIGREAIASAAEKEEEARRILHRGLEDLGFKPETIRVYDHHACHAASAFWPSPFMKAMIVTSDGRGDGLSATLGFGDGARIERALAISDQDSIGQFYAAVTFYLGFRPNRHEGKITGLAAHGDPHRYGDAFLSNVQWMPDGTYQFRLPEQFRLGSQDDMDSFLKRMSIGLKERVVLHSQNDLNTLTYASNWYGLLGYLQTIAPMSDCEDIAAGVQHLAEQVSIEFVRRNLPAEPIPVVLAGGVFSNVRVNQKVRELPGVTNVFVQPAMGDDGLSLGAALLACAECDAQAGTRLAESPRPTEIGHTYLGLEYTEADILEACAKENVTPVRLDDMPAQVGRWIHEGL